GGARADQPRGGGRLGDALGGGLAAVLVERLEMLAVDLHVLRLLAAEHGVGLGTGCDQNRARRQDDVVWRSGRIAVGLRLGREAQRPGAAEAVEQDLLRR